VSTRELHNKAMELFDASFLARRKGDEFQTRRFLAQALKAEAAAADSVANDHSLEPTRSVLHRSAASMALQLHDAKTAMRYTQDGLAGHPPEEIKRELSAIYEDALTLEALQTDYRRRAPAQQTRIQQVIRRFTDVAPVDVSSLAAALGVNLWQGNLGSNSGEIFRDIRKGGFSGYSIRVNAADSPARKRFTAAHELAHFLIHRDRFTNRMIEDKMYRSGLGSSVEAEANRLAADLLMPRRVIRQLIADGIRSPEQMAKIFNVSLQSMQLRLRRTK
jgi:IrrE N-terminal-like domain